MARDRAVDAEVILDALGDPSRRRVLEVLQDGEQPVGRIADRLPIGRPAVSKHLAVLEGAGLVTHHRRGTRNLYALAPDGLAPLQQWLTHTWDIALGRFAELAEAEAESQPENQPENRAARDRSTTDDPTEEVA